MAKQVYLDNAATTQLDERVAEVMKELMDVEYGNPSSIHSFGRRMKVRIEAVRNLIADRLNVVPAEIFFTSGATESINTIVHGAVKSLGVQRIITSRIEHPAVLAAVEYQEQNGLRADYVQLDAQGQVVLTHLRELLTSGTEKTLVALMHANNELGNLLPLKKVSELCREFGAYFFSDTVQSMGKFANDLSGNMLDFAVGSAHKFHGPKGVGFMYVNAEVQIEPFILGGGQERNMRAGTENVYGIAGMGRAFEIAYEELEQNRNYMLDLKHYLMERLKTELPQIAFNGKTDGLHTVLNIALPKNDHNDMILMNMDIAGIAVSGGSACSSGALHVSHVIEALGLAEKVTAVRVSFSKYTTRDDLDYFVEVLKSKARF
jgi:cysteine desulfurase